MLSLWRNDRLLHRVRDQALTGGFAFVGAQGGSVRVRELRVVDDRERASRTRCSGQVDELLAVTRRRDRACRS